MIAQVSPIPFSVAVEDRVKILLVDDQPDNLLSAEAILESLGQEIVKAESGRQALRHLLKEDYAVILLDVMMPGMDGFETASLIRQRRQSRNTPIIFLTGLGQTEEHLVQGYEAGAVDYLFKPIVPEVLRSKVRVFVKLQQATLRQRKQEEAIRLLNDFLEKQVRELNAANRELEAFSYSVSHDLRAPLSRIAGFSQALLENHAGQLDGQGKVYLDRVYKSSQKMLELVDDLLNLSRLSQAEIRREPVDLSTMAQNIAAELQGRAPERHVRFLIQPGWHVSGDPQLLRVVLQNLLENAWKYTRNREVAVIEFGARGFEGSATFYVRDNGAGFDMAQSHRLFRAFQRLHSESQFEGTGIGLATVDRIIKRHGGSVWAEGEVDRGAVVYFTLDANWPREG